MHCCLSHRVQSVCLNKIIIIIITTTRIKYYLNTLVFESGCMFTENQFLGVKSDFQQSDSILVTIINILIVICRRQVPHEEK